MAVHSYAMGEQSNGDCLRRSWRPFRDTGPGDRPRLTIHTGANDTSPMTLHAPRLPFSLAPLIAEARRRARQRRVLSAAAVLMLGLAAGGTTLALHPFGLLRGSQAYTGPFEPVRWGGASWRKQRLPWAYSSLAL